MRKIGILGGTGFVGLNLQDRFDELEIDFAATSKRHGVDARDSAQVLEWLRQVRPDVVVNLAAECGGIGKNQRQPADLWLATTQISAGVLKACVEAKIDRLIMLGTVCFPGETLVETDMGFLPISEVSQYHLVKTHKGSYKPVGKIIRREVKENLIVLKAKGLLPLRATREHPVLTGSGWKPISEITTADRVLMPIVHYHKDQVVELLTGTDLVRWVYHYHRPSRQAFLASGGTFNQWYNWKRKVPRCARLRRTTITASEVAWLLGTYVAEGFKTVDDIGRRGSKHYLYWATGYDKEFRASIQHEYYSIFGKKPREVERETSINLEIGDKYAYKLFEGCYYDSGTTAEFKKVPDLVKYSTDSAVRNFLCGYWRGDGHFSETKRPGQYVAVASSTSLRLLLEIQELLLRLGIAAGIYPRRYVSQAVIEGRTVNVKKSWSLRITGKWAILFGQEILGLDLKRRNYVSRRNSVNITTHWASFPVTNISTEAYAGPVFNLQVAENETFVVQNIAVHNCSYAAKCPTPFSEDYLMQYGPPEPTNRAYGLAKLSSLFGAQAFERQYGLSVCNLIAVNMYGPYDHFDLEDSHVIPAIVLKIQTALDQGDNQVTLWGSGSPTREFLYAQDLADAILLAATKPDISSDFINIGSGHEVSIKELADMIRALMGYQGKICWNESRPDGQMRRCLNVDRARDILGFTAKTELADGLARTIEWFREKD